jgi:hypothetical protein
VVEERTEDRLVEHVDRFLQRVATGRVAALSRLRPSVQLSKRMAAARSRCSTSKSYFDAFTNVVAAQWS